MRKSYFLLCLILSTPLPLKAEELVPGWVPPRNPFDTAVNITVEDNLPAEEIIEEEVGPAPVPIALRPDEPLSRRRQPFAGPVDQSSL